MNTPTSSPWGHVQTITLVVDGITQVHTAEHGGLWVSRSRLDQMPAALRSCNTYSGAGGPWFEEDCEFALVVAAFPDAFTPRLCHAAAATIRGSSRGYMENAKAWLQSAQATPLLSRALLAV